MAIADKLTELAQVKNDIKTAIIAKGQEVGDDMTGYSTAIDAISSGGDKPPGYPWVYRNRSSGAARDTLEIYGDVFDEQFYKRRQSRDDTIVLRIFPGCTRIGTGGFYASRFGTDREDGLLYLPDGLVALAASSFSGLTSFTGPDFTSTYPFTTISIPGECTISDLIAQLSTGITSIYVRGLPAASDSYKYGIGSTAFGNMSGLKNIYVTWSEGEVPGAPWGATNATITYNYTGEQPT